MCCSFSGFNLEGLWKFLGECVKCVKIVKEGGVVIVLIGVLEFLGVCFVVIFNGESLVRLIFYFESGKVKFIIDFKGFFKFLELVEVFEYFDIG